MLDEILPGFVRFGQAPAAPVQQVQAEAHAPREIVTVADPTFIAYANHGPSAKLDKLVRQHAAAVELLFSRAGVPTIKRDDVDSLAHTLCLGMDRARAFEVAHPGEMPDLTKTMTGPVLGLDISPIGVARFIHTRLEQQFGDEGMATLRADKQLTKETFVPVLNDWYGGDKNELDDAIKIMQGIFSGLIPLEYSTYPRIEISAQSRKTMDEHAMQGIDRSAFLAAYAREQEAAAHRMLALTAIFVADTMPEMSARWDASYQNALSARAERDAAFRAAASLPADLEDEENIRPPARPADGRMGYSAPIRTIYGLSGGPGEGK